jgi:hypothetical protein
MTEDQDEYKKYCFNELEIGRSYRDKAGDLFKIAGVTEQDGVYVLEYNVFYHTDARWQTGKSSRSLVNTKDNSEKTILLRKISRLEELMVTGE